MTTASENQTLGLFAHYRPVVMALPPGGCQAVAAFLAAESADALAIQLEGHSCRGAPEPGVKSEPGG